MMRQIANRLREARGTFVDAARGLRRSVTHRRAPRGTFVAGGRG